MKPICLTKTSRSHFDKPPKRTSGCPNVPTTILRKIAASDIFVRTATRAGKASSAAGPMPPAQTQFNARQGSFVPIYSAIVQELRRRVVVEATPTLFINGERRDGAVVVLRNPNRREIVWDVYSFLSIVRCNQRTGHSGGDEFPVSNQPELLLPLWNLLECRQRWHAALA